MKFIDEIKAKFASTVHIRCDDEVNAKIERLVMEGMDKIQVISDFDQTISTSDDKNRRTMSSYHVFEMCESLSEDFKNKSQKIYHKYHPIEKDTQMTVAQKSPWVAEWWRQSELSLHGIQFNYQDIEKSIKKSNLKLRDGSRDAFGKLHRHKTPLVVLSAGVGDVVVLTLKRENLLTDNVTVVSNFLNISENENGTMCTVHGYKGKTIVHIYNKDEHVKIYSQTNNVCKSGRTNVILLGDSLGDANMDSGCQNNIVLRIGYLNKDLLGPDDGCLRQYILAFDIVLVQDQTMGLFNYLLDEIIGKSKSTFS